MEKLEKTVSIAMLQMSSTVGDVEANLVKVEQIVSAQLPKNVSTLVLPEVWTVGWSCSDFVNSAQNVDDSEVIRFLSNLAKVYDINIIGGSYIAKKDNRYFNTCPVINRKGELVALYDKMHLYSYYGCDEGSYITKGDSLCLVELDGVKYGLSICYDIRFPELYRAYAKAGADVLINCAAWGSKKAVAWEMMTKSRAIENQCYMVALTQSGAINDCDSNLGQSRIIDFQGDEIASIMEGEGIVCGAINLSLLYNYRKKAPTLDDIRDDYEVVTLCKS